MLPTCLIIGPLLLGCGGGSGEEAGADATAGSLDQLSIERRADSAVVDRQGAEPIRVEVGETKIELPRGFPADVPLYPGGKVFASFVVDGLASVTLKTNHDAALVSSFYLEELPKQGWEIRGRFGDGDAGIGSAEKAGRDLSIMLSRDEGEAGGTTIRLTSPISFRAEKPEK